MTVFTSPTTRRAVSCLSRPLGSCANLKSTNPTATSWLGWSPRTTTTNNCPHLLFSTLAKKASSSSTTTHFSSSSSLSSSPSSSLGGTYVSPYQDLFESMNDSTYNSSSSSTTGNLFYTPSSPTTQNNHDSIPRLQCGIPETVLKFRTTCYDRLLLAPYVQPGEYKVILQVKMKHLPLETDVEKEIFYQIVGSRFNHELQELKLTSNQFASRIENKRHLCWMLDRIVMGAKRLAQDS